MISPEDYISLQAKEHIRKESKPVLRTEKEYPLVFPEFDLKDGIIRDILESKTK